MSNRLYIVFSSTPYKMGKFIRLLTRRPYNHVSLTMDPQLTTMYSFARYYENTPLYGGFISESFNRFHNKGRTSVIKVCEIPITGEQEVCIQKYLEHLKRNQHKYIYNSISAIFVPVHKKVSVKQAYTCIEFVASVLQKSRVVNGMDENRFYELGDLEVFFQDRVIYEGPASEYEAPMDWGGDLFYRRQSTAFYVQGVVRNFGKLIVRMVRS